MVCFARQDWGSSVRSSPLAFIFTRRACSLRARALGGGLGTTLLGVDLLAHELADGEGSLLSVDHHGEALEVVQVSALLLGGELLGNVGGGPLLADLVLLPGLLDSTGAGTTVNVDLNFSKLESAEGVEAAGELALLALNEDSLAISPVNNENGLAVVLSEVNKSKSSSLNKESKRLKNRQLGNQGWLNRSQHQFCATRRLCRSNQPQKRRKRTISSSILLY